MLALGKLFTTFESCSTASDVFFDDLNQQVKLKNKYLIIYCNL